MSEFTWKDRIYGSRNIITDEAFYQCSRDAWAIVISSYADIPHEHKYVSERFRPLVDSIIINGRTRTNTNQVAGRNFGDSEINFMVFGRGLKQRDAVINFRSTHEYYRDERYQRPGAYL